MIRTYITTAIRYLRKHKFYAGLNILGLGVGLAACLLIMIFIQHELRYDSFHANAQRIVRATMEFRMNDEINEVATTGAKLGPQAARTFPEVEAYARTLKAKRVFTIEGQQVEEEGVLYADRDFFHMFSFRMIEGNAKTALNAPDKIVLTQSTAQRLFGSTNVLGKTLQMGSVAYQVSGVCADAPPHSQLKFAMVTDFMNLGPSATEEQWWTANWITYFMLRKGSDAVSFENKLNAYMQTENVRHEARLEGESYLRYHLEPLKRVHLYSKLEGLEPNGNIKYLYMFSIMGILVLIIAAANYTNLATAQSVGRSGEMGMRKAMGAGRFDLFIQFMGESTAIALLSGMAAWVFAWFGLPALNQVTGNQFGIENLLDPLLLLSLLFLLLLVGFASGAYPAMVISGMRALRVMKSHFKLSPANLVVRRSLIVLQFAISVFLIIYTLVMRQQMDFMKTRNLGYEKDLVVSLPVDSKMKEQYEVLKQSLEQVGAVAAVSGAYETPEYVLWGDGIVANDERGQHNVSVNAMPVDIGFLHTMNMQLTAGRDFARQDLLNEEAKKELGGSSNAYILNESLVRKIGWTPEEAIGKTVSRGIDGKVVGVVKDFHFRSLHHEVSPLVLFLEPGFVRQFVVRLNDENTVKAMASLEAWWKLRVPHRPFTYKFLDESYAKLYEAEQRTSVLFMSFSGLAILLACLGLFGLASFAVAQRTREIGVRRVLGANGYSIIWLLAKHFLLLVFLGVCISVPVALILSKQWLNEFAYRINPSTWVVIISGSTALLVALLTISIQSLWVIQSNPVKSLRTE